ncbi:hypothetical protein [Mailhella massiliensis]|uniref:hypothetical protein n=1 Tax=Mailhella massiliensis TaxID=1903261 RepID=UPI0023520DA7|nr:hypothetical protein [Mailhella massiliensis]
MTNGGCSIAGIFPIVQHTPSPVNGKTAFVTKSMFRPKGDTVPYSAQARKKAGMKKGTEKRAFLHKVEHFRHVAGKTLRRSSFRERLFGASVPFYDFFDPKR